MPSLYEITQNVLYLQDLLESGEIDDQIYNDTIECLCAEDKLEAICKVMKNLEYEAAAYKAEEERMAKRRKTLENGVRRLKDSVLNYLVASNEKKVKAGLFSVSLGKSTSTSILDESKIPAEYRVPQPDKVDKKAILDDLKAGKTVEGAELSEGFFVTIR